MPKPGCPLNKSEASGRSIMPSDNKRGYKVGRGKPPLKTRFKPGQSGNPRGRPKGRRGISALLQAQLQTLIKVTEDGQTKRMTKLQAIVKRLVNALLKGDPKAPRLDSKQSGSIILVMQRLHQNDLSGHLIEKGGFEVIALPARAITDERWRLPDGRIHRRKIGQALH